MGNLKLKKTQNSLPDLLLLLAWLVIGLGLRLMNLTAKPPWTDEFSTLVFSLGNSFLSVPLDQAIPLDILLQPLQPNPAAGIKDVLAHLTTESNHPPLYFVLAHWWMQLFPTPAGLVSLWGARSLPAILSAFSVPAVFGLSYLAFRSRLISQLAAAMMAVSPFGIFLAQEARHYSLAILWVIASLGCLVIATRHIHDRTPLPIWVAFVWVAVNALGIATHYFFVFTLCAEAVVLIVLGWRQRAGKPYSTAPWLRICAVAAGTLAAGLVWVPVFLQNSYGSDLTDWIQSGDRQFWEWLKPIFQAIAAWITMLSLLPVEASQLGIVIASGVVMVAFFVWALPILSRGLKIQLKQTQNMMIQMFGGFVLSAIAIFFIVTYAFGIDLTRGARYNFAYFPAVIVLLGASLAVCWNTPKIGKWDKGKISVAIIWLMGLLSAITVACNLGYQKYYRPDLFVQLIQQTSTAPILIATTHKTHVQIGEMMGVAREFKLSTSTNPQFLLAHQDQNPNVSTAKLQQTLNQLPRNIDLWLVNFYAPAPVNNCIADSQTLPPVDGYNYKLYHCPD